MMKRLIGLLICLLPFAISAQDYTKETNEKRWEEVERLIAIKNYEQTRPILADIKATARQKDNKAEWIRAVLAESRLMRINNTEDDAFLMTKQHFQDAIHQSAPTEKAILHNFYAMFLHTNSYRYLSDSSDDFIAADADEKNNIIDSLFRLSIEDQARLLRNPIKAWTLMFEKVNNLSLSPTLYHFLAYPYMDFLRHTSVKDKDTKINTLEKQLLAINEKHDYRAASSYLLSRNISTNFYTDDFIPAYEEVIKKYPSDYSVYLIYQIASAQNRFNQKAKAMENIKRAKRDYPYSPWLLNIENLEKTIQRANLNLEHQQFVPAQEYTPIKLSFINTDTLYLRVYNTTNSPKRYQQYNVKYDSTSFLTSVNAPVQYEEHKVLKVFGDYNEHNSIYKLNPLPYGSYIVLASNNKDFKNNGEQQTVTHSTLIVSDVFVSATLDEETDRFDLYKGLLIHRKTGKPYTGKRIQLYDTDEQKPRLVQSVKTNQKGEFIYKTNDKTANLYLEDAELFLPEENQLISLEELDNIHEPAVRPDYNDSGQIQIQTMLDRAIYRPGQTVHFKTILYNNHELTGKVIGDQVMEVNLLDANNQKIDSMTLTTNAFGSVHGSFQLPHSTLAGTFRLNIHTKGGAQVSKYFQVEEYKRPTFNVEFEPNKGTYTLKDTAIFVGKVESLAGATLADAAVRYKAEFYNYRQRTTVVYLDTLTSTDADGKFRITVPLSDTIFRGLTDFTLNFSAEVSSSSGEMQRAAGSYLFSIKPWRITVQSPYSEEEGLWSKIHIHTKNQNNQPLKFSGKVDIYKVVEHQKPISGTYQNYFRNTEYHELNNEEYERYFPNYFDAATIQEDNKILVTSYNFDTRDTSLVKIDSNLFSRGRYIIEAYSIQGGDSIRHTTHTRISDPKTRKTGTSQFLSYALDKTGYGIGDKVTMQFYTDVASPENLFLFQAIGDNKGEMQVLKWKGAEANYSFILTEEMISPSIAFNAVFIRNNQAESMIIRIPIVSIDKNLAIKTVTFRDKITPGQKEKWSFTISHRNDKVASELLATLYDSSLDVFAANSFPDRLTLHRPYYRSFNFNYLFREFNQQATSWSSFHQPTSSWRIDNGLSVVRSYGLWQSRSEFYMLRNFDSPSVIEEVVVVGYGNEGSSRTNMTGSSVVSESEFLHDEIRDPNLRAEVDRKYEPPIPEQEEEQMQEEKLDQVQARTNLQETAFFYPTLYTDEEGNVSFEFDSPEALTKWKLLLFAHGKNLESGAATFFTQTQKQLMVQPNLPRYFREGDQITIKAQIQNLSETTQSGHARIEILDPENNDLITAHFIDGNGTQAFEAKPSNNTVVAWQLQIPKDYPSVHIKIIAATDEFSDGEIQEIPVLPNRILISDTEKIILKAAEAKSYMVQAATKENLQARIQVQSNPILEIISSLDYLKNYPYACSEQSASKWFGLKMVEYIDKHYPAISTYFKTLNIDDAQGKLEENASLNELKIEEMPWLRDIQGDEARLKAIAALFRSDIKGEIKAVERIIFRNQLPSGGFPWFEGGKENVHISSRILEIMGKVLYLDKTLVTSDIQRSAEKLTAYLDRDSSMFAPTTLYTVPLDYLYARQYWNTYFGIDTAKVQKLQHVLAKTPETSAQRPAGVAAKAWIVNQIFGEGKTSLELKNRITQEAITDNNRGLYWESNTNRYNGTSLQSYMVEAYKLHDPSKLQAITQWLFYNKQVNNWRTTWMTVDAIYALLLANNPEDFALENTVKVWVDDTAIDANKVVLGQFTKSFAKEELISDKAVRIENRNSRTIYGDIVHQYFVPLEDVERTTHTISVRKQYFVQRNGEWTETATAKLGERIKVKLTIITDADLQYVHVKDSRPSGVEPVYQPSGYRWWQGYYFTMKDASTNYFFDNLNKGKRELEYEVKANNAGIFQSGITTAECMYDPSVNARSENMVLTITE